MSNTKLPKAGTKLRRVHDHLIAGKPVTNYTADRFKLCGSTMPGYIKRLSDDFGLKIAHTRKQNKKTKVSYVEYRINKAA